MSSRLVTSNVCPVVLPLDPDAGGAGGLCRGDSGGAPGEDAAAHRVLPPLTAAQPGWGGPPPRPLPGRRPPKHLNLVSIFVCAPNSFLLNNNIILTWRS